MARAILTLWQTSLVRRGRPTVIDEVTNGLSYYDHTFFRELPRSTAIWRMRSPPTIRPGTAPRCPRSSAWAAGSEATATATRLWTADVLRQTIEMQSRRVLEFLLDELHTLGGELSLDRAASAYRRSSRTWWGTRPDTSPRRAAEPLSAGDRRHLCTAGGDGARLRPGAAAAASVG